MLFVGPVDQGVSFAVDKGVRDAGGTVVRTRSISVPLDIPAIQDALRGDPALRRYLGLGAHRRSRRCPGEGARRRRQDAALGCARQDHRPGARRLGDATRRRGRRRPVGRPAARPDEDPPRGRVRRSRASGGAGRRDGGVGHRPRAPFPRSPWRASRPSTRSTPPPDGSGSSSSSPAPSRAATASARRPTTACCRRFHRPSRRGERPAERRRGSRSSSRPGTRRAGSPKPSRRCGSSFPRR